MMKAIRPLALCAITLGVAAFHPGGACAHSFPETETPAAGQTLAALPPQVSIKFDAKIEKLFAKLEVIGPEGKNVAKDAPVVGDDGYTLTVKVPALGPGDYLVKWCVVGIDTHRTEGSYQFTVTGAGH